MSKKEMLNNLNQIHEFMLCDIFKVDIDEDDEDINQNINEDMYKALSLAIGLLEKENK